MTIGLLSALRPPEPDIYQTLAADYLDLVEEGGDSMVFHESPTHGAFGLTRRKCYSGRMAKKGRFPVRQKMGLFDFIIDTGTYHADGITHNHLLTDILTLGVPLASSIAVWSGEDPRTIDADPDHTDVLVSQALMMFEQEVNWGHEPWQKGSDFNPMRRADLLTRQRPRDMLMGFIVKAHRIGLEGLPSMRYWMRGTTATVQPPLELAPKGFYDKWDIYPPEDCDDFDILEDRGTLPLMRGETLARFKRIASSSPDHPKHQP